jgi:mono/diheme cytochrome c family protein
LTEVPDHLLQRSRDRRKALGLGGDDDGGAAPAPTAAAESPAAASTEVAAVTPAPVPVAAEPPPPPEPPKPWVEAALRRKRIPYWALPVLLFLPIWAFLYVGSLESASTEVAGLAGEGAAIYEESCASCHGADGGGGVGPALAGGDVLATFPDLAGHVQWVALGTPGLGTGTPYGSAEVGRVAGDAGSMPGFSASLTGEQLLAVVVYERLAFGDNENEETIAAALDEMIEAGEIELPENFSEGVTSQEIAELLQPALGESAETATE